MIDALCQRCGDHNGSWTIVQAEFHVGRIQRWKVQLCRTCTTTVETALREALAALRPSEGKE